MQVIQRDCTVHGIIGRGRACIASYGLPAGFVRDCYASGPMFRQAIIRTRKISMLLFASLTVILAAIALFALVQRKAGTAPAPVPVRVRADGRRVRR